MRGRERVVDPDVAELCQFGHERRIVLLFLFMEAGVLQAENVAVLHRGHGLGCGLADAILGEGDRLLDDLPERRRDGFERVLVVASLRPSEMGEQDDLAALVRNFGDGRRDALEPGRVGNAAVLHGHVEVDAQQHALALYVDVIEGAECFRHWRSLVPGGTAAGSAAVQNPDLGWNGSRRCDASLRAAPRPGHETCVTAASPSPRRCPTCGWRNPIHCRTRTSPAPACRSAPWSGPCGTWTSGDRG